MSDTPESLVFEPMSSQDVALLADAVGIRAHHARFIVDRAEQRIRELLVSTPENTAGPT